MDRLAAERMFVKVVECGSFGLAAVRLGTSSGQASKLVARLEADLGVKLLQRTTRALTLTDAGRAYARGLGALLDAFDELDTEVRNAASQPSGRLRLTAPVGFGALRVAPLLARFALEHPGISLEVDFSDRLASLIDEGFDAAIRVGDPRDAALTGRKLGQAGLVILAAPAYLAAHGAPQSPEDLAAHECLLDTNFRDPRLWSFSDGRRVPVTGRVAFSSADACLKAAEAGLGIAYLPEFVAEDSIAAGRVCRLLAGTEAPPIPIHILFPGGRHQPARLRLLIEFLARNLRGDG